MISYKAIDLKYKLIEFSHPIQDLQFWKQLQLPRFFSSTSFHLCVVPYITSNGFLQRLNYSLTNPKHGSRLKTWSPASHWRRNPKSSPPSESYPLSPQILTVGIHKHADMYISAKLKVDLGVLRNVLGQSLGMLNLRGEKKLVFKIVWIDFLIHIFLLCNGYLRRIGDVCWRVDCRIVGSIRMGRSLWIERMGWYVLSVILRARWSCLQGYGILSILCMIPYRESNFFSTRKIMD